MGNQIKFIKSLAIYDTDGEDYEEREPYCPTLDIIEELEY